MVNSEINELEMLFIPENVASSKNGRTFNIKLKRSLDSKSTQKYKRNSLQYYQDLQPKFQEMIKDIPKPLFIGFHFVRDSRRKYDHPNPVQTCLDIMVKHGWLEDDNTKEMYPVPLPIEGKWESYDKENPGVYIAILNGKTMTFE